MSAKKSILTVVVAIGAVLVLAMSFGCSTVGFFNPPGIGNHYVVDLTLDPENPREIIVSPHVLEGLYFGDVVVFNNKTGLVATVKFKSPTNTPFIVSEFNVPAGGSPSAEDATIIVNPKNPTDYEYQVTAGDSSSGHGTDQSPVIRVGPRPHSDTE